MYTNFKPDVLSGKCRVPLDRDGARRAVVQLKVSHPFRQSGQGRGHLLALGSKAGVHAQGRDGHVVVLVGRQAEQSEGVC